MGVPLTARWMVDFMDSPKNNMDDDWGYPH